MLEYIGYSAITILFPFANYGIKKLKLVWDLHQKKQVRILPVGIDALVRLNAWVLIPGRPSAIPDKAS